MNKQPQQKDTKTGLLDRTIDFTIRATGEKKSESMRDFYERFAIATKSGERPSLRKVEEFLAICKNRGLDPYAGDAWLVGYDSKDGPQFSIIVSYQSLAQRAEANDAYDGIEAGIVVDYGDGELEEIHGALVPPGANLIGGWARVHRKDRKFPAYARIPLDGYDKNRSLWNTLKPTMIAKCAKAAAMRDAFPADCGGLSTEDEVGETTLDKAIEATERKQQKQRALDRIAAMAAENIPETEYVAAGDGQLFETHPNAAEV